MKRDEDSAARRGPLGLRSAGRTPDCNRERRTAGRSRVDAGKRSRTPALEHHADVVEGKQVHGRLLRGAVRRRLRCKKRYALGRESCGRANKQQHAGKTAAASEAVDSLLLRLRPGTKNPSQLRR